MPRVDRGEELHDAVDLVVVLAMRELASSSWKAFRQGASPGAQISPRSNLGDCCQARSCFEPSLTFREDGRRVTRFNDNWQRLEPLFGHLLGPSVGKEECRNYHAAMKIKGYADGTLKTDLELLRACLRWKYGNAAPALWVGHASPPRERWLTKEEARTILAATATPHIRLFIILGLTTGARGNALLQLTWDKVDFDIGTIDFRPAGRVQKNKRRTVVPMNGMARQALEEAFSARLTDHVIEYGSKRIDSVKKAIERLARKAGIPFLPHVLRHTCAVWMAQTDVPMHKISQYLGRTSTSVTEATHARYSASFMKDASAAVEF